VVTGTAGRSAGGRHDADAREPRAFAISGVPKVGSIIGIEIAPTGVDVA